VGPLALAELDPLLVNCSQLPACGASGLGRIGSTHAPRHASSSATLTPLLPGRRREFTTEPQSGLSVHSNDVPRFVDGGWFIPGTLERVSQKSLVVPNVPLIGSDIGSQLAHQKLYNTCVISSSRKTSSYRERITTPRTKNNMYQRQSTNKMHIVHLRWSRHANQRTTKIRLQQLWCVLGATSLQPNVG
jgi:hypothetical protein